MHNAFSLDQVADYLDATFRPHPDQPCHPAQPRRLSGEQQSQLAEHCNEFIPYAEVLCGNSELVDTAMTHAFGEATEKLWSSATPGGLRVGFKRILIDSCFGVREQAESLGQDL